MKRIAAVVLIFCLALTASAQLGVNLLDNPEFSSGTASWTLSQGEQSTATANGRTCWYGGTAASSVAYQAQDLSDSGVSQVLINAGLYSASASAMLSDSMGDDSAMVYFQAYGNGSWTTGYNTGWYSGTSWQTFSGSFDLEPGTDDIRAVLNASRVSGTVNNGYIDDVQVVVSERSFGIASSGNNSSTFAVGTYYNLSSTDLTVGGATGGQYGGLYVKDGADLYLDDLTINSYGTVYLRDSGSTLSVRSLNDGGTFQWDSGNLILNENGYLNRSVTVASGRILYLNSTSEIGDSYRVAISGGTCYKNSTAVEEGVDLAVSSGSVYLNSGTVQGGFDYFIGGNVYVSGGVWNAEGVLSSISDSANVFLNAGTVISSGTIDTGDFYWNGGTLRLEGGTHNSSYTLESAGSSGGKYLDLSSGSTLNAGSAQLNSIYDSNQIYLNGGTINCSAIDPGDFTFNSGHLNYSGSLLAYSKSYDANDTLTLSGVAEMHDSYRATITGGTVNKTSSAVDEGDDFAMSSGSFYIENGTVQGGLYDLSGGNVYVDGGTWDAEGTLSSLNSAVQVYINGGSLESSAELDMGDVTFNKGTLVLSGGSHNSSYTIEATGTGPKYLYINSGATLNAGSTQINALGSDNQVYLNGGILYASAIDGGDFTWNSGDLHLNSGDHHTSYTIESSGTGAKSLYVDSGAILSAGSDQINAINSDDQVYLNGGTISCSALDLGDFTFNSGHLDYSGSSLTYSKSYDANDTLTLSGTAEMHDSFRATIAGGTVNKTSSAVDEGDDFAMSSGTFNISAGTVLGGLYDLSGGNLYVNGGTWDADGTLAAINNNANVYLNGASAVIKSSAGVDTDDFYWTSGTLRLDGGTQTAYLDVEDDSGKLLYIDSGAVYNAGATGLDAINSGNQVYLNGGTLIAGTLDAPDFTMLSGRLEAITVNGSLAVNGTFAPGNSPADSTVDGDLTLSADDTVEMELGGYVVGTGYDRLTVTGAATLDGTLSVVYINGFNSPTNGTVFDLFNWDGTVSGSFDAVNLPALSSTQRWETSDLYVGGTLSVSSKYSQVITDFTPADSSEFLVGDTVSLSAAASSGMAVVFTNTGDSVVQWNSSTNVRFTGIGTVHMIASQSGDDDYLPVSVTNTWVIHGVPTVNPVALERPQGENLRVRSSALLANAVDPEGSDLRVTAVAAISAQGYSVSMDDGWVFYTPAAGYNSSDSFTFTVENEFGATAQGTANITVVTNPDSGQQTLNISSVTFNGDDAQVRFIGIPGRDITIQAATNLVSPVWVSIGTGTFGTNGVFDFTETNAPAVRFYRTVQP